MAQAVLSSPELVPPAPRSAGLTTERAALAIAGVMLASIAALGMIWFAIGMILR